MSETASHRLARVLALVPHIVRRPGISLGELAAEFDVSGEQIAADLDLLMVCGDMELIRRVGGEAVARRLTSSQGDSAGQLLVSLSSPWQ